MTKINYSCKEGKKTTKSTDTVKMKVLELSDYNCKFIDLEVNTKETGRKEPYTSAVIIPIPNISVIDDLISGLKEIKKTMKPPRIPKNKTCDFCQTQSSAVQKRPDPYIASLQNREQLCLICDKCHAQKIRDT